MEFSCYANLGADHIWFSVWILQVSVKKPKDILCMVRFSAQVLLMVCSTANVKLLKVLLNCYAVSMNRIML